MMPCDEISESEPNLLQIIIVEENSVSNLLIFIYVHILYSFEEKFNVGKFFIKN